MQRLLRNFRKVPEPDSGTATISLHSITSAAAASSDDGTGRPSGLPAANGEPWSAVTVAAIVVAGASVVVVAPAGEVAGVVNNSAGHSAVLGSASSVHNTRCRPDRSGRR